MFSIKVNGALAGYFKRARGLRQGDLLSPYLFVLAMDVLSMILLKDTVNTDFKFHWRTKETHITHICFADDLLVFCYGNPASVSIVNSCIQSFSLFSRIIPNA